MIRILLALVAALVATFVVVSGCEFLTGQIFPIPKPYPAPDDVAGWKALIEAMPFAAKLAVVAGWILGAAASASVAVLVSRKAWMAWVGGGLTLAAVIWNAVALPHPTWMVAAGIGGCLMVVTFVQVLLPRHHAAAA